jgi:hypothetical protein
MNRVRSDSVCGYKIISTENNERHTNEGWIQQHAMHITDKMSEINNDWLICKLP